MSISNKSIHRINKAVETIETTKVPVKPKTVTTSAIPAPHTTLQKSSSPLGITQKIPDYLL